MTTDCLGAPASAATHRLHDAILGLAVAVLIVLPAGLALISLF